MLAEPLNSEYDLHFRVLGIPVRVTWLFWVIAIVFGYDLSRDPFSGGVSLIALLLWVSAMFLSILVHEFGHSLAMRYYGIDSRIVLYHFGGLAIPSTFKRYQPGRTIRNAQHPAAQLVISLAGPVVQLLLAAFAIAIAVALDVPLPYLPSWFREYLPIDGSSYAENFSTPYVAQLLNFIVIPSVYWAILNLLPVLPLDGGRVLQHTLALFGRRNSFYEATMVSVIVAILVAFWAFQNGQMYIAIFFAMFAFSNFQNMNSDFRQF